MVVKLLCLLLPMIPISISLDIDLASIRVVPDLHWFCWRQYTAKNYGYLKVTFMSLKMSWPIFKDPQTEDNIFCIEDKEKNSSYYVRLPLWGLREHVYINIYVNFSIPFTPVLPVIRKKIVSNGVHFQLMPNFAEIFNNSETSCSIFIIYGPNKKEIIICFLIPGSMKPRITLKPGTEFDFYYFCNFGSKTTEMTADHGTIFSLEKTQPLQPFLQFPFTRFLVGQWRNPPNVADAYQIEIYEISASNIANCLKVFRLYSSSKSVDTFYIYPDNCDKRVNTEDLGTAYLIAGGNVYVVLDMGVPLKKDVRYKMSIWWRNSSNQWEENFIYFEPLPNENSGNIDSDIYNYEPSSYENIRNNISDIWQNVIPQYSTKFLKLSKFDEMMILPTISSLPFKRLTSLKIISYDELNEKCKEIPSCSNGFHPLFYVMLTNKSQTDNFVELLPIPLKESFYVDNLKSSFNSENGSFIISFKLPQNKTNIPSLFAIRLRWENNACFVELVIKNTRRLISLLNMLWTLYFQYYNTSRKK